MPETAQPARISYAASRMNISAPFNAEFVAELKERTKSRRWDPEKKVWTVSAKEKATAVEIVKKYYPAFEEEKQHAIAPPQNADVPIDVKPGDRLDIWTDGACSGNPGPGGYAVVIKHRGEVYEKVGGFRLTTNNRMEIIGSIIALAPLKTGCRVKITTDSQYVVNSISKGWASGWRSRGWIKDKKTVPNWDLWDKLLSLCEKHEVEYEWVKGHNDQPENERCNELAESHSRLPDLPDDAGYEPRDAGV
jgi:ribonuclease HI